MERRWTLVPARDHGLGARERLRSLGRERGLTGALAGAVWRGLTSAYLHAAHHLTISGRENLPPAPFVIVANHASHLDALVLAVALKGREAYALAAEDTFFVNDWGAGFAAYAINALPIRRRGTTREDLATLRRRLAEESLVLILFPEGTRSRSGRMAAFKPGVGVLVAASAVPVVPCWIEGAGTAWPADQRWPRPGRVSVRIGTPLRFEDAAADRDGATLVAATCESAVRALAAAEQGA